MRRIMAQEKPSSYRGCADDSHGTIENIMADIVLSFQTTAAQDAKLVRVFANQNEVRVSQGKDPYATIEEMLTDFIHNRIRGVLTALAEEEANEVRGGYMASSQATKDQIETLLGLDF